LERAAQQLGMQQAQPGQIGVARSTGSTEPGLPTTAPAFINPSASFHH
jgi:hypothetical protein